MKVVAGVGRVRRSSAAMSYNRGGRGKYYLIAKGKVEGAYMSSMAVADVGSIHRVCH